MYLNSQPQLTSPYLASPLLYPGAGMNLTLPHRTLLGCTGRADAVCAGGAEVARRAAGRCAVLRAVIAGVGSVDFLPAAVRRWAQGSTISPICDRSFTPIRSSFWTQPNINHHSFSLPH